MLLRSMFLAIPVFLLSTVQVLAQEDSDASVVSVSFVSGLK